MFEELFDNEKKPIFRWGITYLRAPNSRLPDHLKQYLLREATEMYLEKDDIRRVKLEDLEGTIRTEGKTAVLGGFSGIEFYGAIEHQYGKDDISFLVSEQTGRGAFVFMPMPSYMPGSPSLN